SLVGARLKRISTCAQALAITASLLNSGSHRHVTMFKKIGDLTVHCEEWGTGKPLVLVHGGQCRLESWRDMIPFLTETFRVHAYDLRAHGQTLTPPEPPQSQEL